MSMLNTILIGVFAIAAIGGIGIVFYIRAIEKRNR